MVFVRKEEEAKIAVPKDVREIFDLRVENENTPNLHIDYYLIGFCGRVYPVLDMKYEYHSGPLICRNYYAYSVEQVEAVLAKKRFKHEREKYYSEKKKWGRYKGHWFTPDWSRPFRQKQTEAMFTKHGAKIDDEIFFNLRAPIFVVAVGGRHKSRITANSTLKQYGFGQVFPSYQAYQEISMYLGGVLGNIEKDTVGIDDEHLKTQKGFDKWSFKKMPTKRR